MPGFSFTGAEQTWVVPAGVTEVLVECWGAEGGHNPQYSSTYLGGKGGYARGRLAVTPGETLRIYVGGHPPDSVRTAGWNGGGTGGLYSGSADGSGGGGASDVRQGGAALANRVIVAGGGGGAGAASSNGPGGSGGGLTGGNSNFTGGGGTQSAGGVSNGHGSTAGSLGQGGNGGVFDADSFGGGGGGGYYGGGGGGYEAGGGGSGYTGGVTDAAMESGVRTGDGFVRIQALTVTAPADNETIALTNGVGFAWEDAAGGTQEGWALKRRSVDLPPALGNGLQYGAEEWWSDTAQEVLSGPSTVLSSTGTLNTGTAYSNQRKVDRTSNGVLWVLATPNSGTSIAVPMYSIDNGATWTQDSGVPNGSNGGGASYARNFSFFIDQDDYAHIVFKDNDNGWLYYRRGTPNAARTAWTWSAATSVTSDVAINYPDIVAFRTPGSSPTTWDVCIVASHATTVPANYVYYERIRVANNGALTTNNLDGLTLTNDLGILGGSYGVNAHPFPSIDFNHTGDGKTVAGGTPHLYTGWTAGSAGAGKGIRFRKATYSTGTWTWGTEREIDNTLYVNASRWLNCLFDGTRVVLVGSFDGATGLDIAIFERDAADTTTTPRSTKAQTADADRFFYGSATYDADGDLYILGQGPWATASGAPRLGYRKWARATLSLDAATTIIDTTDLPVDASTGGVYLSAKRGHSANRVEWIYTDSTSSVVTVQHGSILLAAANSWVPGEVTNPGTATSKTITDWPTDTDTYQYAIATADAGGLGAYTDWRTLNPWEFWDGDSWVPMVEQVVASAVESVIWPNDTVKGPYLWTVATDDGIAGSPYATPITLIVGGAFERWGMAFI